MIEKIVLDHLEEELGVPCMMEVPETPPETFVVVEKTGSDRTNRLNYAMMAVQSYAPTLYMAAELNERVKGAMDSLILLPDVTASKLNSDYNFTDTSTKRYRYQAIYDINYY